MEELIRGKFQRYAHFGFVIPEHRSDYGGDFFINKENFKDAEDGDKVEIRPLKKYKGKKPEAKIINVLNGQKQARKIIEVIEWVYSWGDGNFGFIDVVGLEKGYFVYGKKKNGARDWDRVKAEIIDFKWKKEAVVVDVLDSEEVLKEGLYKDHGRFGFVLPEDESGDIFIAGGRKNEAEDGDKVLVKIIKQIWKNPEGLIMEIL